MANKDTYLLFGFILLIIILLHFDFASASIDLPLKQFKSGISVNNIICRGNLELIIKESGFDSPACVNPDSKTKLVQRGWAQNITDGTTRELVCGKDFLEWGYGMLVKTTGFLSASPLPTNSQNMNNAEIEKLNESKLIQFTLLPNSSGTITMLYDKPCNSQGFETKPALNVLYNFFNSVNSDNIGLQKFDESITGLEHITGKKGANLHIYVSNVENYQNNSVLVQYAVKSSSDTGRYLLSLHRTCPGDLLTIDDKPYSGNMPPYFKGTFYGCR